MEEQHFLAEELFPFCCKQRCRRVSLLMGGMDERDTPGLRKGCGRADTRQEAGHVASLHGARLLGNAHRRDLGQIKLSAKLLQHLGQSRGMVEERITLPQAQLALLDRQKTFLCANNLSGCVKNRQRGCIVACVDAQRIVAHCSSDSTGSVSRPCSRATAPSRPFTN